MKRVSFIMMFAGLLMCLSGLYMILGTSDVVEEEVFDFSVTEKEKSDLLSYLSNKYRYEFEVIDRVSRYCIVQKEDQHMNYSVDKNCNNNDIIDDIFKVKDKDGITFYVKKVSVKEGIDLLDSIKNIQSKGFYDNYLMVYLTKKLSSSLTTKFEYLGKISNEKIFYGLGIENDLELANSKNLDIYKELNKDVQNIFTKDMSNDTFIANALEHGLSFSIGFYIKVDMDITAKNIKTIVSDLKEKDVYNLGYDLKGNDIIIEFNNKRFIKYKDGYLVTINEYDKDVFESNPKMLYKNAILLNNDSFSEEGITLNNFMNLREAVFNF